MKKVTVKKFGVWSVSKIMGAVSAIMGLFLAALFVAMFTFFPDPEFEKEATSELGLFIFLFIPIAYGILGMATGALMAYIYNMISPSIGGLEIEMEESTSNENV